MDSISLNDLGQSGFGSNPLNNCLIAAFGLAEEAACMLDPITVFCQNQDTWASAPLGTVEWGLDLENRDRWALGCSHLSSWAMQQIESTILHGILRWFFLNLCYLHFVWFPSHLEQVLTLECGVWPQRNAVALPANRLSCWMGWALGGTDLVIFWPWLFQDGLGWWMPLTLKGTYLEGGDGTLWQAYNFPYW